MDISQILPVAAIAISAGSMAYTWRRNAATDSKLMWEAIRANNTEIALLKKQGDLFWGLIEQQMAKALIRPTHVELDRLLEKLVRNEKLEALQKVRLEQMLRDTVDDRDEQPGVRAMAATILAVRLARKQAEHESYPCD